ncbi:MAG: UpxY family transcription antiterminator [Saprospiraceae bacterium]|nr:UpxY family transcription antiterminator [Saprospiraceae bacterium]
MFLNPEYNWNVLIVKPKSEKRVGQQLKELGFETCVPIQKQIRQWSDRKKTIETVLFYNYVFVETTSSVKNDVFKVANVIKYLQYLNKPAVLRPNEVALVKQLSGVESKIKITYDRFTIGDLVEIRTGPLIGQRGYINGINGSEHIQLSLPSLNCFANVELSGVALEFVGKKFIDKDIYNYS